LEHRHDGRADGDVLMWITDQVAEHADPARVRQLDEHDDVGPRVLERGMHRVPHALPAVDRAAPLRRVPAHVERETRVADPLRAPLPRATRAATLHAQLPALRTVPVRRAQAIGLGHRARQPRGQVRRPRAHSADSLPKITLETGVTIGPAHTIDTCGSGTWLEDWPRSCRTASSWSSSPCM